MSNKEHLPFICFQALQDTHTNIYSCSVLRFFSSNILYELVEFDTN